MCNNNVVPLSDLEKAKAEGQLSILEHFEIAKFAQKVTKMAQQELNSKGYVINSEEFRKELTDEITVMVYKKKKEKSDGL